MKSALFLLAVTAWALWAATPPEQPIPFSHKVHAGTLKVQCKLCHPNPDPGESMTITAANTCMQCHATIKTDSPAIRKLAAWAEGRRVIQWVRVYQIPADVKFSHRAHLEAGNRCEDCHGTVATRDQLSREGDISMGGCMGCHRMKKVSIDCALCHENQ